MGAISPCKNQPRKTFKEESIKELAESMEANGLLLPIIIRPNFNNGYEIVAGERRYRAAKLLGWDTIPAIIKSVTDEEMLEIQVLENLQREDMSPLDEAAAFQTLLKKESIDWLSSKIHKSKKYILDRIKLNDLCLEAKLYLTKCWIPLGHAMALSKIKEEYQEKVMASCFHYTGFASQKEDNRVFYCTKNLNDFKVLIYSIFQDFKKAPFDLADENLIEGVPSCNDCEKRTCNQNLLFGDITSNDSCTDPICFKSKSDTHIANLLKELKEKHGKAYSAEWDNYGSSSHNIKANGQKLMMLDKPVEGSVPVVITKSSNGWHSEKVGKVGYVIMPDKEEIEKAKEEKKQNNTSNSMSWEERQKQKFETITQPRLEVLYKYYESKKLERGFYFINQVLFHYINKASDLAIAAALSRFGRLELEIDKDSPDYLQFLKDIPSVDLKRNLFYWIELGDSNTNMLAAIALLINELENEDSINDEREEFDHPSWFQLTKDLGIHK